MKIREKLLDLKRRLQDRKMYSIVILIIAAVALFGFYQYKNASSLRQELDNRYNSSFYDMIGYVNNVEVLLAKALITSTPEKSAETLQEAWRQANLAQTHLSNMPVPQHILARTSKFLNQVGDFSYTLNTQNMYKTSLDDKQFNTLESLHGYSYELGQSLSDLQHQLASGRLKWGELARKGTSMFKRTSSQMPQEMFESVDKTFQEYPELIYDGPFSDHMTTIEPKGLSENIISIEDGKNKVLELFKEGSVASVENMSQNDLGNVKSYSYNVKFKNSDEGSAAIADITQRDGKVLWMLNNRAVDQVNISIEQAKEAGKKYLESIGFKNMVDTYYLREDNTATINYAYKQQNVVIYPDLVKVKIALDTGEALGIESKGYIYTHEEREIPQPRITMEEARAKINPRLEIQSSGMAIIPTEFRTEILTYEFKGRFNDMDFLVYINAENGHEENILMIINTPQGILTM